MTQTLRFQYPLSHLPDDLLAAIYSEVCTAWRDQAPALSFTFQQMLHLEALRRGANRSGQSLPPGDGFVFTVDTWSDRDVAEGLRLASGISIETTDPVFGELMTEMCKAMTILAHYRLVNSSDPRNATTLEQRHRDNTQAN